MGEDLHERAAFAVYVSYKYFRADPTTFREVGGKPRYYAYRILKLWCEHNFVQVPAPLLTRYVGYPQFQSATIASPEYGKNEQFRREQLHVLYKEFERKMLEILQNRAKATEQETSEQPGHRSPTAPLEDQMHLPVEEAAVELPQCTDNKYEVVKLQGELVVQPLYQPNAKRRKLEDVLREAILNTGGKLV